MSFVLHLDNPFRFVFDASETKTNLHSGVIYGFKMSRTQPDVNVRGKLPNRGFQFARLMLVIGCHFLKLYVLLREVTPAPLIGVSFATTYRLSLSQRGWGSERKSGALRFASG